MSSIDCEAEPKTPSTKPLLAAFLLTFTIFIVEAVGGWWTGSLALLADAVHMGVDLSALGMGLLAANISRKAPDAKRTFGYQRVEVLAALANGILLLVVTGVIFHEAYLRFLAPSPVMVKPMLAVAFVGLAANMISGFILFKSSKTNINVRGVFLHVMADTLGSVGVIVSGFVILMTGWIRADAVASAVICVAVIATSVWLVRDSVHILLEGAPAHLDINEIRSALSGVRGVREVHDLHLWSITRGQESLSGHLVLKSGEDSARVLKDGVGLLKSRFGLSHVTLQLET